MFGCAPKGKEQQLKEMLHKEGISHSQLIASSTKEREQLDQRSYETDLVMMPSRREGFSLTALESLSLVCLCFSVVIQAMERHEKKCPLAHTLW